MSKRYKPNQKASRRDFTRSALSVHPKNIVMPKRGGIRL